MVIAQGRRHTVLAVGMRRRRRSRSYGSGRVCNSLRGDNRVIKLIKSHAIWKKYATHAEWSRLAIQFSLWSFCCASWVLQDFIQLNHRWRIRPVDVTFRGSSLYRNLHGCLPSVRHSADTLIVFVFILWVIQGSLLSGYTKHQQQHHHLPSSCPVRHPIRDNIIKQFKETIKMSSPWSFVDFVISHS